MIHEFQRPIQVDTPIGGGVLLYVQSGGTFANDVFAVVLEKDGGIRHFLSDQIKVIRNDTFDIRAPKPGPR